jgi:hypothetical protein
MPALQLGFEVGERGDPALGVLIDPPVVDQSDRHGIEEMQLLPARLLGDQQTRFLEHLEMFHDPEAGHLTCQG